MMYSSFEIWRINMNLRYHFHIFILILASTVVSSCALISTVVEIEGVSMLPNFPDGTLVTIVEIDPSDINRGDVIYFNFPLDPSRQLVKRVIGLPGETVEIEDGKIYIDGELLEEPYSPTAPAYSGVWMLNDDEFFVLGDNRNASSDSHLWGAIYSSNIIGLATPR
jgi:signal peptidase I